MIKLLIIFLISSPAFADSSSDTLRDFILEHQRAIDKQKALPSEINPVPPFPEEKPEPPPVSREIIPIEPETKLLYEEIPVGILYKPEVVHSFIYYNTGHLEASLSFFGNEYNEIEQVKGYLGELSILDPVLSVGMVKQDEDYFYKVGISTELFKDTYGLYFKLEAVSTSILNIQDESYGRAVIAYYYSIGQSLLSHDFLTLYAGWKSEGLKLNLDNLDSFKSNFKFERQKDNLSVGAYYMPFIDKKFSFNAELSKELIVVSVNLHI